MKIILYLLVILVCVCPVIMGIALYYNIEWLSLIFGFLACIFMFLHSKIKKNVVDKEIRMRKIKIVLDSFRCFLKNKRDNLPRSPSIDSDVRSW